MTNDEGKVNRRIKTLIEALLCDQPIAYHPILARAAGSTTAAVLLSQLLYWTPRAGDPTGWFFKTRDEITAETALTRAEQEGARAILRTLGIVEEVRRGVPARMYYRVDMERLAQRIDAIQLAETLPSSWRKFRQQDGGNPANKPAEESPTKTEITPETTSEISSRDVKQSITRTAFSLDRERAAASAVAEDRLAVVRQAMAEKGIPGFRSPPPTTRPALTATPSSGPPPEYIATVVADMVRALGDESQIPVNVSQAMALWEQSGVSVQAFVDLVYEVEATVRRKRTIKHKLAYAFTCLRRSLTVHTTAETTAGRDRGNVVWTSNGPRPKGGVSDAVGPAAPTDKRAGDPTIDRPPDPAL